MNREQCLQRCCRPQLRKGDSLHEGSFFRNLKDDEVQLVYPDDDRDEPRYGYKVRGRHWTDSKGALSVSQVACIQTPACSLLCSNPRGKHKHVVEINLSRLAGRLKVPLVAVYDPTDDPPNPCHFEIMGEDGTLTVLMQIKDCISEDFPPGKLPRTEPERQQAAEARRLHSSIFQFHRFPLGTSEHVTAAAPHDHAALEFGISSIRVEEITTEAVTHDHALAEQSHFTPQEWDEFRAADKTAAAYIVILMQGIFIVGLVLYLIVLWSVT
jgi:hypothetical protein